MVLSCAHNSIDFNKTPYNDRASTVLYTWLQTPTHSTIWTKNFKFRFVTPVANVHSGSSLELGTILCFNNSLVKYAHKQKALI